jgi:bifunctional DNA-binding transcriptional regulator/antitoxin component of YhaV-PrlF toxin-antitoxin module
LLVQALDPSRDSTGQTGRGDARDPLSTPFRRFDPDVVDPEQIYDYPVCVPMARWREMLNAAAPPSRRTKVSRNGTVVLAAPARRAAGIAAGDEVVTIPVGPGAVLVERVGSALSGRAWREFLDSDENPLRGMYGGDPQAYVDELRAPWRESTRS